MGSVTPKPDAWDRSGRASAARGEPLIVPMTNARTSRESAQAPNARRPRLARGGSGSWGEGSRGAARRAPIQEALGPSAMIRFARTTAAWLVGMPCSLLVAMMSFIAW